MQKNEIELLAPAGSYDAFISAINAGADAVYMGVNKFNARAMAKNFEVQEYVQAIDYAHMRNVKVYLTLNTLMVDDEIDEAISILTKLYEVGLDAVILQDIGLAHIIHNCFPKLAMHASTQMSVLTLKQVEFLKKIGFKRVVLGRELSINEIKYICDNSDMEIEVFVHGALCVSVSGQCMLSSMIGDRSANGGSCAQPCRMKYSLYNKTNRQSLIKEKYILSKKDIYGLDKLSALRDAGVTSVKIEGRNKTAEYVAGVVNEYRKCIQNNFVSSDSSKHVLMQLFNRNGISDGYLTKVRYKESITEVTAKNTGIRLGKIIDQKGVYIKVLLEENINLHDGIEVIGNDVSNMSTIVTCIKNMDGIIQNKESHAGDIVWLGDVKGKVKEGDAVYKTSSYNLNQQCAKMYKNKEMYKKIQYIAKVTILNGKNIMAEELQTKTKVILEEIPQISQNVELNCEKIEEVFSKTDDSFIEFKDVKIELDNGLFVPVSVLNKLRRELIQKITETKLIRQEASENILNVKKEIEASTKINTNTKTNSLFMYKFDVSKDYVALYQQRYDKKLDKLYIPIKEFINKKERILLYAKHVKLYAVIPNVVLNNLDKYITENIEQLIIDGVSGIVLGNLGYIDLCQKLKEKYSIHIIGDYFLNVTNTYSAYVLKKHGIDCITPIFENFDINYEDIAKIVNVELVEGLATAMTSRYCVISSYVQNASCKEEYGLSCIKNDYYLIDGFEKVYDIVTDCNDCIMSLIRNKRKYDSSLTDKYSVRYNISG